MTSSPSVDDKQREALCKALLPPLSFARRDDFKFLERLSGVDGLVDSVLEQASPTDPLARALRAAASGFDADTLENKRRRVTRLIALLDGSYTPKAPAAAPASTTSQATATKPATPKAVPRPEAPAPKRAGPTLAKAKASTDKGDVLTWPLSRLKGVGPLKAAQLHERGLLTVGDVLFTLPRTYEDRREKKRIADVEDGLLTVVAGTVQIAGVVGGGRGRRFEATIDDGSGLLRLVFFHFKQGELMSRLARGNVVTASGEVKKQQGRPTMVHPRLTAGDKATALGGVSAVYPEIKGLHPLELGRVAGSAVDVMTANPPPDPLPPQVVAKVKLPALVDALTSLHKPPADVDVDTLRALVERRSPGHMRLAFEELFVLGTALSLRRLAQGVDPAPPLAHVDGEDEAIKKLLPFSLTGAQRRASGEILADLQRPQPMARLLQGDVGAGKTAVAAVAALRAARAGFQTAFMAPTEILAEQHGRTLKKIGFASGLRVEVLTGSVGKKARALIEARLRNRDIDIVVGTQALLSEGVTFAKLGLCIVDEQHRFGVVQRALLRQKGPVVDGVSLTPHLLVMTATPIPRSLTLTVYGDLSVSILDELPPGRTPIVTKITPDMHAAVDVMRQTLARNERAFVVYPLIDESEKLDVMAASAGFDDLRRTFLRDDGSEDVVLLHGKMPTAEKDAAMAAFARGDKRVLVSTTVIEVGVDVPQASLMVIVNAERFGLAQLHQLRGRVGRGAAASTCLLVPGDASHDAIERLQTLEETTDGFRIAEKDLELRGAGDVLGTRQSGLPSLAFSDVVKHARLIETARDLAEGVVVADPTLSLPEHAGLRRLVHERYADRLALTAAG